VYCFSLLIFFATHLLYGFNSNPFLGHGVPCPCYEVLLENFLSVLVVMSTLTILITDKLFLHSTLSVSSSPPQTFGNYCFPELGFHAKFLAFTLVDLHSQPSHRSLSALFQPHHHCLPKTEVLQINTHIRFDFEKVYFDGH